MNHFNLGARVTLLRQLIIFIVCCSAFAANAYECCTTCRLFAECAFTDSRSVCRESESGGSRVCQNFQSPRCLPNCLWARTKEAAVNATPDVPSESNENLEEFPRHLRTIHADDSLIDGFLESQGELANLFAHLVSVGRTTGWQDGMEFCLDHNTLSSKRSADQLKRVSSTPSRSLERRVGERSDLSSSAVWSIFYRMAVDTLADGSLEARVVPRDLSDGYPIDYRMLKIRLVPAQVDSSVFVVRSVNVGDDARATRRARH
jgi:hypothetical protein